MIDASIERQEPAQSLPNFEEEAIKEQHKFTETAAQEPDTEQQEEEETPAAAEKTPPTLTKKMLKEKGTPVNPIPIKEREEERAAAAAEQPRLIPVLRRSVVAKVSLFTDNEKSGLLTGIKRSLQEAEQLKDLAKISAQLRPTLPMGEMTPLATKYYESGTSSQVANREEDKEEEEYKEVSINESLQIITEHLKNIQVQSEIDKGERRIIELQALHMAEINDELQEKLQNYHLALAVEKSNVEAERERTKSFMEDKADLAQRLSKALKINEEKDKQP